MCARRSVLSVIPAFCAASLDIAAQERVPSDGSDGRPHGSLLGNTDLTGLHLSLHFCLLSLKTGRLESKKGEHAIV